MVDSVLEVQNIKLPDSGGVTSSTAITLDASGNTTATLSSSSNIKAPLNASGDAPVYACRAWATFKDSTIYASGNCSSIADLGTAEWQMNFDTAMPTQHYSVSAFAGNNNANQTPWISADQNNSYSSWKTTTYIKVAGQYVNNTRDVNTDSSVVHLAMFC